MPEPNKPLVPQTAAGVATVGGLGAAILASLGWLATEFIEIEQRLTRVETRWDARITSVDAQAKDIRNLVEQVDRRLFLLENAEYSVPGDRRP